jgi:adenylate cyclase
VHSLQLKFSAVIIALLAVACASLAYIGIEHERAALVEEIQKRALALTVQLALSAQDPMFEIEQGKQAHELTLELLVADLGKSKEVRGVRLLNRAEHVVAAAALAEFDSQGRQRIAADSDEPGKAACPQRGSLFECAAPVIAHGLPVGEAQVEFDPRVMVDPVIHKMLIELSSAAVALLALGVLAGMSFVALLVGPLKRLRHGVEQMSEGNVMVRVPPTSHDEVGELTRAFNEMGDSLAQKQRVQNAFGRYVDDYVLSQLLDGDGEEQAGIEREVTVLFVDIRRFTRLSEGMKAPDVVALLNEVFQTISDRILEQGGTIDKFIGDSVMAYFGAPVPHNDHPLRAVQAAMEIIAAIDERNHHTPTGDEKKPVPVQVGIGIHTGNVVVGNIGSDRRTDYTAIGDAVNVAHRLEKIAPPGEILVSEAVQRRVCGSVAMRFEGERQLSGREEPVHVYAVAVDTDGDERIPNRRRTSA